VTASGRRDLLFRGVRTVEDPSARSTVRVRGGKVAAVDAGGGDVVDGHGDWLLPGWIDLQVNDIEWLAAGVRGLAEHRERIRRVLVHQIERGTTAIALATLAAPEEEIVEYLKAAAEVRAGREPIDEALLGILVEGTFMNPAFHGAHNPDHVRKPSRELLDRFIDTGGARMVNIAPEMSEDALDVIAHARRRGIVVGVGHAKPSGERTRAAVERGLSYVIHLGNGPTGSSLKGFAEGGLMEEALRNDGLFVTIIADGVHLDRRLVRDIIARKGPERVAAVSDAAFALSLPEGEFTAFGVRGAISRDGRCLRVVPPSSAPIPNPLCSDAAMLFGSAIVMKQAFENLLNWLTVESEGIYHRRHAALSLEEAVRTASILCSDVPARIVCEKERGALRPGTRADLVLASIEGEAGAYRVSVKSVWLGGIPRPALSAGRLGP